MGIFSRFNRWRYKVYQRFYNQENPTLQEQIELHESRGDYSLARNLAELAGEHKKARELYVLEIGKLVDEKKFEDAGRVAESYGYLHTALEYYRKAGWQPAVARLEEAIGGQEEKNKFWRSLPKI